MTFRLTHIDELNRVREQHLSPEEGDGFYLLDAYPGKVMVTVTFFG